MLPWKQLYIIHHLASVHILALTWVHSLTEKYLLMLNILDSEILVSTKKKSLSTQDQRHIAILLCYNPELSVVILLCFHNSMCKGGVLLQFALPNSRVRFREV